MIAAIFTAALVAVDYFGKKLGNASEPPAAKCVDQRRIRSRLMFITRRVVTTALSLTGLSVLAGFSPLRRIVGGMAQSVSDVDRPVSLPEMALGPANAFVTIIISIDDLFTLRGIQRKRVSEDQIGIY